MKKINFVVRAEEGLHARPAACFVETSASFSSSVVLVTGNTKLNAKSILSVLSAGITKGTPVSLEISGDDEAEAETALSNLVSRII